MLTSFVLTQPLKHSRNRSKIDTFHYCANDKPDLCVDAFPREYLSRRSNHTDHKQLITTYGEPYKPVTPNSIHRFVKELFTEGKICNFTPHLLSSIDEQSDGYEHRYRIHPK